MQAVFLASLLIAAPDIGGDALKIFAQKCGACHGSSLAKPKGDPPFGYVTDLRRLAADRDKITPGNPDASDLWKLVSSGNMPPGDAKTGPLSPAQKATVKAWIVAGAPEQKPAAPTSNPPPAPQAPASTGPSQPPDGQQPAPASGVSEDAAVTNSGADSDPSAESESVFSRTLLWLGKWHLLLLHFPIALIVASAGRELWSMWKRTWEADDQARLGILLAGVAAVPVALLGWLYAYDGAGAGSPNLEYHRWLGTAAALFLCALAYFSESDGRVGRRSLTTRVMIFTAAGLVSLAAHFGAKTLHGSTFLDW